MPLVLRIENVETLPDGGPVFVEIDRRGIDIGRDTYLDWTLPDPERFISGKHCEIHFRDSAYWLHDVSTNGTSVNGQPGRLTEPHKLAHGDRIHIGPYIVQTELSGVEAGPGGTGPMPDKGGTSVGGDPWGAVEGSAEAIDRRDFSAHSQAGGRTDGPADFVEENISWGFGDVSPPATNPASSEWGAAPELAAPSSEPATPVSSDYVDWGASVEPVSADAGGGSPWDLPPASSDSTRTDESSADPTEASAEPDSASPAELGDNPFLSEEPSKSEDVGERDEALKVQVEEEAFPPSAFEAETHSQPETDVFGALSESHKPTEPKAAEPPSTQPLDQDWVSSASEPAATGGLVDPVPVQPTVPNHVAEKTANASGDFIKAFECGAGLPEGSISGRSDDGLAEELGVLFREVTQSLQAMLLARAETKSAMRSSERTMIGALENNPLKFSPTPEDALRIMFGQKTRSYLDASQTITQSFADLQKHQVQTFGAMQSALQVLIEDLDPENIAGATAKDGGLAGLVGSRRAKFWDTYVERFSAKSAHHDRGMIDAFMILFAEMYDRQG